MHKIDAVREIKTTGKEEDYYRIRDAKVLDGFTESYHGNNVLFCTLFDMVPGGVSITTDISCEEIIHNPVAAKFLRIQLGQNFSHSASKQPPVRVLQNGIELTADKMPIQRSACSGEEVIGEELEFVWEDGVSKTAIWSTRPVFNGKDEICSVIAISEDITERKRLQQENEKYRSHLEELLEDKVGKLHQQSQLIELAHDAIIVRDLNNKIMYWNNGAQEIYGWESHEAIGKVVYTLLNTIFSISFEEMQESLFNKGLWDGDLKHTHRDGKQIVVSSRQVLYRNQFGEPKAILEINRNDTVQKRVEQFLCESEERFTKAFYSIPICASINEMPGTEFTDVNNAFLETMGFERSEVIGRSLLDLRVVDKSVVDELSQMLKENVFIKDKEITFYKKSGEKRSGIITIQPINISVKTCHMTLFTDITEKKHTEKEMLRLAQLNLIGELSAGIGHEIRNPMTTVRGFLQLLRHKPQYHEDEEFFELMISELDRANGIITEFLSLAKNKPVDLKLCCLNSIIKTITPLIFSDAIKSDKEIKIDLRDIPKILLDEKEIRQLIFNLVRNGLDAMNPGGTLYLATHSTMKEVTLQVEDNGCGIPKDVIDKIGHPFVTTKENGTGLGLSVCYGICHRHNSKMEFRTSPKGTIFYVRFPVV